MKIALLVPSLHAGGAERQMVNLANGLAHKGHSVFIFLFRKVGILEVFVREDVTLVDLRKKGQVDIHGFMFRLISAVKRFRPDVLYSFLGAPNMFATLTRPFVPGMKVVWSVRASDMDMSKYGPSSRLCHALEPHLSRFSHRVIANSQAGQTHAVRRGFQEKFLCCVPNGIDTEWFTADRGTGEPLREIWQVHDSQLLVGLVARLDPMKDHRTFLRAVAELVAQRDSLRFVCVGGGPLEQELLSMGRGLGINDMLVWPGECNDMPAVYNALDICCLSSMTEGFPNVLGEAMACGVPCVTTNVGDAAEVVKGTGLVVPPGDPVALAGALLEMAARVHEQKTGNPRDRIVSKYSVATMVQSTEKILQEVLL